MVPTMCGRWTSVSGETSDLRRIKLLNVVDELTREALAVEAAHSIDADGVLATVERLVAHRGAPAHLRMDQHTHSTRTHKRVPVSC